MPDSTAYRTWTDRDLDIVETLALKVPILSLRQIASTWWSVSDRQLASARRRLALLDAGGLICRYTLPAHPILQTAGPVFSWSPGEPPPQFEAIAWRLQRRWTKPSQPTAVLTASKLAAHLFGSFAGKRPNPQHATHDLHVGEVYLWYRRSHPNAARHWLGEAAFPKAGFRIKDPDAFLIGPAGQTIRVIEFGGRYNARRISEFHQHCLERHLPYELW